MDVRYSTIVPLSGSTFAVISFILIPRIPRIVFLASSIATSAASSQLLFDVPTISTILAILVIGVSVVFLRRLVMKMFPFYLSFPYLLPWKS